MASRAYSKSLDFQLDYITIGSLRTDGVGETITIQDSANDITRWAAVSIYEDLFRNFLTCEIAILDQDGFFLNRLRTEEVIVIKFKTPSLKGFKLNPARKG
jgi:hypothetical protein